MSKLSIVKQTLEEKAIIVHVEEENRPLDLCMCWTHRVDFYIAPKEAVYKADELNKFMDSLIPDTQPDYKTCFKQEKYALFTGALCFDEKIGEARIKYERFLKITDSDMLKGCEWTNGRFLIDRIEQVDYMRKIIVRPYPNKDIIEEIIHHNLSRWKIDMRLIWKYHEDRTFWQKLISKLRHEH